MGFLQDLAGLVGLGGALGGLDEKVNEGRQPRFHGRDIARGATSAAFRPELLQKQKKRPMMGLAPRHGIAESTALGFAGMGRRPINPAQQMYPGSTNYGVPQDNMIDTSMGYLTNDQFNQGYTGQLQGGQYPQDFYGRLRVR